MVNICPRVNLGLGTNRCPEETSGVFAEAMAIVLLICKIYTLINVHKKTCGASSYLNKIFNDYPQLSTLPD
jgi:hypothetical protein